MDELLVKLVIEREVISLVEVLVIFVSFYWEWNEVCQDEYWFCKSEDEWYCEFWVCIDGVLVKICGMMKLKGDSQVCINQVCLMVCSDLLLVGKKLVCFFVEDFCLKIEDEYQVIWVLV